MAFVSVSKFEKQLNKQTQGENAINFGMLPVNRIFRIDHRREVQVDGGIKCIITVVDKDENNFNVWAPERLCKEMSEYTNEVELFIRYKGKVDSKLNQGYQYFDYDLIKI